MSSTEKSAVFAEVQVKPILPMTLEVTPVDVVTELAKRLPVGLPLIDTVFTYAA